MPPQVVLEAFGLSGLPVPLHGGQGRSWRLGDVVLKPSGFPPESRWRAETLAALGESSSDIRLARPVPALDGDWVARGWEAFHWVAGQPDPSRIDEILVAGNAFHALLARVPRPSFLDERADAWSYGDAVAWEEQPLPELDLLEPLAGARRPVDLRSQMVHGDLAGNVLFADPLPPAIIDWPAYWRPPSWASAVAVVDVLCWHDAPADVVDRWSHLPSWDQMLIRALIYRIATEVAASGKPRRPEAYRPAIDLVLACA